VEAHILVVDDDVAIRELIKEYLAENNFQVSVAETGADMDKVLSAEIVDLVILDLKLPDEDGLAIARRLRESLDLPIIILTGRKEEVDRVMGLELGADDYVTKPFSNRELLARVRAVLRRTEGKRATRRGERSAPSASRDGSSTPARASCAPRRAQRRAHQQRVRAAGGLPQGPRPDPVARPAAGIEPPARRHLRSLDRRADPAPAAQGRREPQPAQTDQDRARRRLLPRLARRDGVSSPLLAIDAAMIVIAAWIAIGLAGVAAIRSFRVVAFILFPASAALSIALAASGSRRCPRRPRSRSSRSACPTCRSTCASTPSRPSSS
jgi:DNA-binding response OmpR family regulator